jgi:uncharacterized membrane protein YeaQ/YmgE (transglycosylase-associated protein family)
MSIVWALLTGLIIGAIAKLLMPGRDPGGYLVTILLGIAGSLLATFVGRMMGLYDSGASAGWIMSVVGAIVVLLLFRLMRRSHA